MLILGIASGLPILLVFGTLSVWLREAGIERATISFLSWAGLSYGFKFIWAPLMDNLQVPWLTERLGRRRSWILVSQLVIILALLIMSSVDPTNSSLTMLALGAVLLAFASATQDIVIDAYRIEIADADYQAMLAGVSVAGYRIGMLVAGAGALQISEWVGGNAGYSYLGWQTAYSSMAAFMLLGIVAVLMIKEPAVQATNLLLSNKSRLFLLLLVSWL